MGFGIYAGTYVIDEAAVDNTAQWQLVVETPECVNVIYLSAEDDLGFWKEECVRLFGVYPRVYAAGNFVELHA